MAGNEDSVTGDGGIDNPWHEAEVQLRAAERNAQEKPKNQGNRTSWLWNWTLLLGATDAPEEDK